MRRQALNVFRMRMLGAEVRGVSSGSRTLKDAVNEALRDWVTNVTDTHYIIGSAIGPHPFPTIVRDFQSVIGRESRAQMLEQAGRLPDYVIACVGGGSNSIGCVNCVRTGWPVGHTADTPSLGSMFHGFIGDESVKLIGVEAGGEGVSSGKHSATLVGGRPGVLHGTMTYLLQDDDGQVRRGSPLVVGVIRNRLLMTHASVFVSRSRRHILCQRASITRESGRNMRSS